jgi:hypothetical protein
MKRRNMRIANGVGWEGRVGYDHGRMERQGVELE